MTSSSKLQKKQLLICVLLYVKIFFSLNHKQSGVKTEKLPKETTALAQLDMSHVCSVSDCQSLDESGLNHSAIGGACKNDQGFIYKQLCGDI